MELRHLRYFVAAVEEGSLHAAAERMNIAQPALSRRIRDLEAELGCDLLARGVRGVTPTTAGAVLYRDALNLLEDLHQTTERTRRRGLEQGGFVRLGLVRSSRRYAFIQEAIADYSTGPRQPNISFTRSTSTELADSLRKGRLDMTLLFEQHVSLFERGERFIHGERYILAVHPAHRLAVSAPVDLAELSDEPIVWLSRRDNAENYDTVMRQCRLQGLDPIIAHMAYSVEEQLDVTMATGGVCFTPAASILSTREGALLFRPLPRFEIELPLSVAWRPDIQNPPSNRLLLSLHAAIDRHREDIRTGRAEWARLLGHPIVRVD